MAVSLTTYGGVYGDLSGDQTQRLANRTALANAVAAAVSVNDYVSLIGQYDYEVVPGTANDRITLGAGFTGKTVKFVGTDRNACFFKHYPRTLGTQVQYCFYSTAATSLSLEMVDCGINWPDQKSTDFWAGPTGAWTLVNENGFWIHRPTASYPNHGTNNITLTRVTTTGKGHTLFSQTKGHSTYRFTDVDLQAGFVTVSSFDGFSDTSEAYDRSVEFYGDCVFDGGHSGGECSDGLTDGVNVYAHPHVSVFVDEDATLTMSHTRTNIKQFSGGGAQGVAPARSIYRNMTLSGGGFHIETSAEEGDVPEITDVTCLDGYISLRNSAILTRCTFTGPDGVTGSSTIRRVAYPRVRLIDCTWNINQAWSTGRAGINVDTDWDVIVSNPTVTFSGSADTLSRWIGIDSSESRARVRVEGGTLTSVTLGKGLGILAAGASLGTNKVVFDATVFDRLWAAVRMDTSNGATVDLRNCNVSTSQRITHCNGTPVACITSSNTTIGSLPFASTGSGAVSQRLANKQGLYATPVAAATSLTLDRDSGYFTITGTGTINTLTYADGMFDYGNALVSLYSQDGFTLGSAGNIAAASAGTITAKTRVDLAYSTSAAKWARITQPSSNSNDLGITTAERRSIIQGARAKGTTRRA